MTNRKPYTYPTTVRHSDDFYLQCLLHFIDGLKSSRTHRQIAQRLNDAGLRTPQGIAWSDQGVKTTLKKIRLNADFRSSFHSALLRLVYAGRLTVEETMPLFIHRPTGGY